MKKITAIFAALCLSVCLCACGGGGNSLFSAASPETSALTLYICSDGKTVRRLTMYDAGVEREILDKLARVRAKPAAGWSARDAAMPVYGLEIGRNDGAPGHLPTAWTDGRLILADGSAYEFGFDFAALETDYDWRDSEHGLLIGRLPCSRALALCEGEWISSMLTPAREPSPPEGISMALEGVDGDEITVRFRNDSGAEWSYGTYYHLETLLGGAWYEVPPEGVPAFTDIAILLPDGEARRERYSTAPYGALPAGTYRFVAEGMAAQFNIFPEA